MSVRDIAAVAAGVILSFCLCAPLASAVEVTEKNLPEILKKVLRENPDILIQALRDNSEAVLDVAQQGANLRRIHNLEAQWKEDAKVPKQVKLSGRPVLGAADARVRIVEFTDFTCHYCQQASQMVDAILKAYGKDVSLVFKSLPHDTKGASFEAAKYFVALAQQDQKAAWEFYRQVFAQRDRLLSEGEPMLKKLAESLHVDMRRLQRELQGKKVENIIKEDLEEANRLGIEGTPHFFVNNLVVRGSLPLDLFKSAVDMALKSGAR